MQAWRLNIKTGSQEHTDPREFCFDRGILGVGWPLCEGIEKLAWEEYRQKAEKKYKVDRQDKGWWRALNAIANRMKVDDLVWTRDSKGVYYLARVLGEWRYEAFPENLAADVVNVRECNWKEVGPVDAVPGRVANSFSRGGALASVPDNIVLTYSAKLYDELAEEDIYADSIASIPQDADLFSLLSDFACEDLVGTYLQVKEGYSIVPSSCKRSTPHYEFVMKHKKTGERAVAQVKGGAESLQIADYATLPVDRVFLFTARGQYRGPAHPKVECLEPNDMERFARENPKIMSEEIARWIEAV